MDFKKCMGIVEIQTSKYGAKYHKRHTHRCRQAWRRRSGNNQVAGGRAGAKTEWENAPRKYCSGCKGFKYPKGFIYSKKDS